MQETNNFDLIVNEVNKEKEYENIVREALQKQRAQGIRIGMLACSKIVIEKLNDTSKSLVQRIDEIKKFCGVAMKDEKMFLNKDLYNVEKDDSKETNE